MAKLPALDQALRFLQYRSRTVAELRSKLLERGYEQEETDRTIERLLEVKLLDDEQFAQNFARNRLEIMRRGKFRIGLEMLRRGVPKTLIEASTAQISLEDELVVAKQLLEVRQRTWKNLDPQAWKRRAFGLLQRRGFAPSVIRQIVFEYKKPGDLFKSPESSSS